LPSYAYTSGKKNGVKTLMKMSDVINVVEEAFRVCREGKGKMPAKKCLALDQA
jgi:hypothetical protein